MPTQLLTVFSFRRANGETGYLNRHEVVEDPLTIEKVRTLEAAVCATNQIIAAALVAVIPLGQAPAVAVPCARELTPAERSLREILPYASANMSSLIRMVETQRSVLLRSQLARAEAVVAALPH